MQKPWEIDVTVYPDETALLEGLRHHERMACTCALKQHAPRLLRLAYQLMGDADEAEDVLQESLIAACAAIDTFEGRSGLGTWLHRIVRNTALMRLRKTGREPVLRDSASDYEADTPDDDRQALERTGVDQGAEPGVVALEHELRDALDRAVAVLPDTLRAAFVLRDVEGLSTAEAARALGISKPALKVRLHRARLALRDVLAPYIAESAPLPS